MAIAISNLTAASNDVGATSVATASITPTSNNLILLSVTSRTGITANPNTPTATGCGLTWVLVDSVVFDTTSASRRRVTTLRALGASPSSGAVTIDFGGQTQTNFNWAVDQLSGVDTTGTNGSGALVQHNNTFSDINAVGSLAITLAALTDANSATYGVWGNDDNTVSPTAGTGFTLLANHVDGSAGLATEYKLATTSTDVSISFASQNEVGLLGMEIKAAGAVVATPTFGTPRLLMGVGT